MMRRCWSALAVLLLAASCDHPPEPAAELGGLTMGTSYSVKIAPPPDAAERDVLARLIDARLAAINRQMSTYLEDSDLMRFNRAATTEWQPAPTAVIELVERARRISELSDGMYDITVGPLVNLWGFGNAGSRETPPTEQQIRELLPRIGYRHLDTRSTPPALRKAVAGLQIDLSSIAKGWAVDQIAELLVNRGIENFVVEIGGEVYAHGEKRAGHPWRIAIERPSEGEHAVLRVVPLRGQAMATSGDYRNFFTAKRQRYSHTIDPKTGQAIRHQLAAVTVFADHCTEADAWATALMALGDEHGPAVAESQGLLALFVVRTPDGVREQPSAALRTAAFWPPNP